MPVKDRERKSASMRGLSQRVAMRMHGSPKAPGENEGQGSKSMSRGFSMKRNRSMNRAGSMNRTSSLSRKMTRNKSLPKYGSRARTGPVTLRAKEEVVKKYPGLEINIPSDMGEELLFQGINSIKAELIDLNSMCVVMNDNKNVLTLAIVMRFFDWIPLFKGYVTKYMIVEEDFIVKWLEQKKKLKGDLGAGKRMRYRGSIQKALYDVEDLQEEFVPQLPAGQKLPKLITACEKFTEKFLKFFARLEKHLLPHINRENSPQEIEKQVHKIVKHLVSLSGYQDFLAISTRWIAPAELLDWKRKVLLPCDFKFFSYKTWDTDMDNAHYQIAANFGDMLEEQNRMDEKEHAQRLQDFERAKMQRREMQKELGDDEVEYAEEEEWDEEEEKTLRLVPEKKFSQ